MYASYDSIDIVVKLKVLLLFLMGNMVLETINIYLSLNKKY